MADPSDEREPDFYILGAEHVGNAFAPNGQLTIGSPNPDEATDPGHHGEVVIDLNWGWYSVYVRRSSRDLSVMEVCMARHDGLAQEELDRQNDEAQRFPLGPKEYWRGEMVGKFSIGIARAQETDRDPADPMTDEDFELDWAEGNDD